MHSDHLALVMTAIVPDSAGCRSVLVYVWCSQRQRLTAEQILHTAIQYIDAVRLIWGVDCRYLASKKIARHLFYMVVERREVHAACCQNLVRLPAYHQQQLQSVLSAATRLVLRLHHYDHITDAVTVLHWLRLPQWVDYKVMAFGALHGLVPPYLDQLVRVADLPGRRRLRSSSSHQLHVPAYRLSTAGRVPFRRCIYPLELSATWHSIICFSVCFLPAIKDASVSSILYWRFAAIICFNRLCYRGLRNNTCYFSQVKNYDWLIETQWGLRQ